MKQFVLIDDSHSDTLTKASQRKAAQNTKTLCCSPFYMLTENLKDPYCTAFKIA